MDKLQEFIEDKLNIPYITEEDAVLDGCFMLVPISTSGIRGNGKPLNAVTSVSLELFYSEKSNAVNNALYLWFELNANGYHASDPNYTYEKNASGYRASMYVEILEN